MVNVDLYSAIVTKVSNVHMCWGCWLVAAMLWRPMRSRVTT